jgi:hypothetical protein
MKLKFIFGLLTVSKILSACGSTDTIDSGDVNNDKIYQSYSVSYLEDSKNLTFEAQFRVGGKTGTTVRLVSPSTVTVNGNVMIYHDGSESVIDTTGSYYKSSAAKPDVAAYHTFAWTNAAGEVLTNILEEPKPIGVKSPAANSSHSIAEDLTVSFSGDPIKPNEWATVSIIGATEPNVVIPAKSITDTMSVSFTAEELKGLQAGIAKIQVSRWSEGDLQSCNPDVGGKRYSSWTAKDISIVITK